MTLDEREVVQRLIDAAEQVCLSETAALSLDVEVIQALDIALDEARALLDEETS